MASYRYEIGVGLVLLTAGAAAAFMALKVGALDAWGQDRVHVTVPMVDAAGLKPADEVTVAGVSVGQIESLGVDGDLAVAHLALDRSAKIRTDAVIRVRQRSLLGEKYLEVEPGSADPVAEGGTLPQVGPQMEIDEVILAIAPVLQALDPEAVARVVDALSKALAEDPDRLTRMLANADRLIANGATASDELPGMIASVRGTTANADRALRSVEGRADQLQPVIAHADQVISDVQAADPGALVTSARVTIDDTRKVVATLDGTTGSLKTILDNLSEVDKAELERMLREEGVLIRLFPKKEKKR